ncbi:hypothetical protein ESCO_005417 [Escovopsis weberi]|uniref:Uncharacterized protein n=1 Tax=Escovopsis weberi TaxID=150374 RepID=A0A0N0RTN6_ESCWE|nr:hypothetical protein ESCO_005417 [Escovopsis weberi]
MPPSAAESSTGLRNLESRFIKAVFDNMTEKPNADWARVAADMGLKDAKCARERFRQMSLRHGWGVGSSGGGGGAGDGGAGSSPVKGARVAKKPRTPRKKAKKEESDEEEEGVAGEMVQTEANFDGEV